MPITDRSEAKESGFAQVREALSKFKGRVTSAEFDMWGGELVDPETGKKVQPREFLEITTEDNEVLEVTEELSMDISQQWTFRVKCSDYKGSFWVEMFLASADKFKVRIPDGLINKVVTFEKVTLEAYDRNGERTPKFDSTGMIIAGVEGSGAKAAPKIVKKTGGEEPAEVAGEQPTAQDSQGAVDYMAKAADLAVGKTEAQFKTAIALDPVFVNNPLLSLAKAGLLIQALINDGKLTVDGEGKYKKPD